MDTESKIALLQRFLSLPSETEWIEFKENNAEDLGEYISALANAAALNGQKFGYLIFGVRDSDHAVVGTSFEPNRAKHSGNQLLLPWLNSKIRPRSNFEIFDFVYSNDSRVVIFKISAAIDQPVTFNNVGYVRIGPAKTLLSNSPDRERTLWNLRQDWSAVLCEKATLDDLDPLAIKKARAEYLIKETARSAEIESWDDITFLNKTKIAIQGSLTRTAILLLGKPESAALLSPSQALITWLLKSDKNEDIDYLHVGPPFIFAGEKILARIRNLTIRTLPSGTLFPVEYTQYDPWVIREALHNCIAHQDYMANARIQVVETPSGLLLTNCGSFLPGSVENVIKQDAPLEKYRNPFLAQAMVNLNMIDTQGGGIKKMFRAQKSRSLPLPDYDLSDPNRVQVTVSGRILDERYAKLLLSKSDLPLETVILLDRVQKRKQISKEEFQSLRRLKLVEGRYPSSVVVSALVTHGAEAKGKRLRDKGFNTQYYKDLILQVVKEYGEASREDIDQALMPKLPEILAPEKKRHKIHNLLGGLRDDGKIVNTGNRRNPRWKLVTS